jgi:hypothetical protein
MPHFLRRVDGAAKRGPTSRFVFDGRMILGCSVTG